MIFRLITKFILPYILLFAFYIQLNGESSSGGGFQAGSIIASAAVALHMINNKNLLTLETLIKLSSVGVLLYLALGCASLFFGYNYLNYSYLSANKHLAQSLGIFIIELGIAVTVSSVMLLIYYAFDEKEVD